MPIETKSFVVYCLIHLLYTAVRATGLEFGSDSHERTISAPPRHVDSPRKTAPYFLPQRASKRDGDYTDGCK
jgi:hypothetical protein